MISFSAILLKFGKHGEKTNWTYLEMPEEVIQQLNLGNSKSFRVKGLVDAYLFNGLALTPMGGGAFIMPLKAAIIKTLNKEKGAMVRVQISVDMGYILVPPHDLLLCLLEEPKRQVFLISFLNRTRTILLNGSRVLRLMKHVVTELCRP